MSEGPFLPGRFPPARVERIALPDGGCVLRSRDPLRPYPHSINGYLRDWAALAPGRTFLAERDPAGGWRRISYGEMLSRVRSVAQYLLDQGASLEHPVAILSENSIAHATVTLAAMHVGIPVAPLSPAYSTVAQAVEKLLHCYRRIAPRVVFAETAADYGRALADLSGEGALQLVASGARGAVGALDGALATAPSADVARAHERVGPDSIAKILFTSGSTGMPKGVVTTQRMLSANQQQFFQLYPLIAERPPVVVDWLPWSHCFGGNEIFNLVLRHGGTLYIDAGRPVPGAFAPTLRNLREVSPSLAFNVPRGYAMLASELERDETLCRTFFRELDLLFYAGSALPQGVWDQLDRLSRRTRRSPLAMVTAWGTTETAPLAAGVHFPTDRASNIGLPVAGCDLKLAPVGDRLELRVRGPNVMPGYWKDPEKTRDAFDAEGYYRTGDGAFLADPDDPAMGVVFDGRVAEDFKLATGGWVSVGKLRVGAVDRLMPIAQDAVVTGQDRDFVGLLVFLNLDACRRLIGADASAPAEELAAHQGVVGHVRERLRAHNEANPGSSLQIRRAVLLVDAPSIAGNEITDKAYINQRAVLTRRARLVECLYDGGDGVIEID